MKDFFKKIWEKIKAFGLKVWGMIKKWFFNRALPWLKKNWMQIVNIIVLFIVYGNTDKLSGVQTITGLWLFVLLAYYIFWKFFGAEKMFEKKSPKLNPQPEPPKPEEPVVKTVKPKAKKSTKI